MLKPGTRIAARLLVLIAVICPGSIRGAIFRPSTNLDVNMALGNPSNARPNLSDSDNYLLSRPQFVMSYNRSRGGPNWVSWHLQRSDLGRVRRTNLFMPDPLLPPDWQIRPNDYLGSSYDRGHQCPSGDRTRRPEDNAATFVMSNMLPQTGDLNRYVWEQLESYCRELAHERKELYIVAGGSGRKDSIAQGRVSVPARCWKVVLILPEGDNDLQRITANTRVIAVSMPNIPGIMNDPWRKYLTTVRAIEKATGYDLFSRVPKQIQDVLETRVDAAERSMVQHPGGPVQSRRRNASRKVWVNTNSGVYWRPGTRYYGKTKEGKYMSEEDALKHGYTAAKDR